MSWVDRINGWVVGRLRPRPQLRCVGDELQIGAERLALREVDKIVGYQENLYVGERLALALSFGPERVITISQEDRGWGELLRALDRLGLTDPASPEWTVRLLAGEKFVPLRDRG